MSVVKIAVCAAGLDKPEESAKQLAEQGVEAIETEPNFFLRNQPGLISETARIFYDQGVRLRSVHAPFGKEHNLSSPDESMRESAVAAHEKLLRQCAFAGVSLIVVHPGTSEAPERVPEILRWCVESLRRLAPTAEETGVKIAVENMLPKHPGITGEQLMTILDEVGSDALGICFDTGHAHCNGRMKQVFETVKDRLITFHLADNDGIGDLHFQPPYGTINWIDFVRVYRTMDFDDYMTVETAPWGRGSYRSLIDQVTGLFTQIEERIAAQEAKAAASS